jgi:ubiquinone/menaquinone biosynthesis C-methylase UbiE
LSHDHSHGHTHSHSHHHSGLVHSHDHHHGPSGDWTGQTARWYADKFGDWPSQRLLVEHLAVDGADVVDVGCGTGALLRILAAGAAPKSLVGVDGSPEMVAIARAQTSDASIRLVSADATALPLADASADLVVFLNALHHIPEPGRALAEAARVLRPGGAVWVGTDEDVYDMAGWSNGRVRDELSGAGFRRIRQTSAHEGDVVLNLLSAQRSA